MDLDGQHGPVNQVRPTRSGQPGLVNQVRSTKPSQPGPVNQVRSTRSGPNPNMGGGTAVLVYTWLCLVANKYTAYYLLGFEKWRNISKYINIYVWICSYIQMFTLNRMEALKTLTHIAPRTLDYVFENTFVHKPICLRTRHSKMSEYHVCFIALTRRYTHPTNATRRYSISVRKYQ